mgnify:CR=1 FL=1
MRNIPVSLREIYKVTTTNSFIRIPVLSQVKLTLIRSPWLPKWTSSSPIEAGTSIFTPQISWMIMSISYKSITLRFLKLIIYDILIFIIATFILWVNGQASSTGYDSNSGQSRFLTRPFREYSLERLLSLREDCSIASRNRYKLLQYNLDSPLFNWKALLFTGPLS